MTLEEIEGIKDAEPAISEALYEVMRRKGVLEPQTHAYLSSLMTRYVDWEESPFSPSVHGMKTEAFVLQLKDAIENPTYTPQAKYLRFKSIGDTLLVSVGYWTESLSTIRRDIPPGVVKEANERAKRETKGKFCKLSEYESVRQPLAYYAAAGVSAYMRAASTGARISPEIPGLMLNLSKNFKQNASVLHALREKSDSLPFNKIEILIELADLLEDESVLTKYTISVSDPRKAN